MVRATAGRVDETSSDAPNQQRVVNRKLDNMVQLLIPLVKHAVQLKVHVRYTDDASLHTIPFRPERRYVETHRE